MRAHLMVRRFVRWSPWHVMCLQSTVSGGVGQSVALWFWNITRRRQLLQGSLKVLQKAS